MQFKQRHIYQLEEAQMITEAGMIVRSCKRGIETQPSVLDNNDKLIRQGEKHKLLGVLLGQS